MTIENISVNIAVNEPSLNALKLLIADIEAAVLVAPLSISAEKFFEGVLDGLNFPSEFVRFQVDPAPAGALNLIVSVYPTDFFRMLPGAIRAGDVDRLIIEQCHFNSPVG